MLQAQDHATGDAQPQAGEPEMFCSTRGAKTWSSSVELQWEMVGRDLLGPSRPVDQ